MLALFLLAIQCHGLVEDFRFKVIKCSTDDGQPELTFTIDKEYFEENLSWQADQEGFELQTLKFRIATSDQESAKIRRQPEPVFHRSNRFSNSKKFILVGNVYQKTVPENQLEVNLENECEFFNKISSKEFMSLDLSR